MPEAVRHPDQALLRAITDLQRRVRTLERLPSGRGSIGAHHQAPTPACRLAHSNTVSIADNTLTILGIDGATTSVFGTERWDIGGMHDPANPGVITAPIDGLYDIGGVVTFSGNTNGERHLYVLVGGAIVAGHTERPRVAASPHTMTIDTEWIAAAGTSFQLMVYQNSGGALDIRGDLSDVTVPVGMAFGVEFWASWKAPAA